MTQYTTLFDTNSLRSPAHFEGSSSSTSEIYIQKLVLISAS